MDEKSPTETEWRLMTCAGISGLHYEKKGLQVIKRQV